MVDASGYAWGGEGLDVFGAINATKVDAAQDEEDVAGAGAVGRQAWRLVVSEVSSGADDALLGHGGGG